MKNHLNKLHHVCIVVHDIDKAQAYYESIGFGPWQALPSLSTFTNLDMPDRDGFLALKYRFCDMSNFQLQLCEPNEEPTPQRIFLDTKGEGVFHLGFDVPDADVAENAATNAGMTTFMRGRRDNGTGFNYYDTQEDAGVVLQTRFTNRPET